MLGTIGENKEGLDLESDFRVDANSVHVKMMKSALDDAGNWCSGVKAIEVWVYSEEGTLEQVDEGTWVDQSFLQNDDPFIQEALRTLYNVDSANFEKFKQLSFAPGEGLPGILWSETSRTKSSTASMLRSSRSFNASFYGNFSFNLGHAVTWRSTSALAEDPDQPYNLRLQIIHKAGLQYAAGIPFHFHGTKGIVIYLAQNHNEIRSDESTEQYMVAATEHLGALLAMRKPRHDVAKARSKRVKQNFKRASKALAFARKISLPQDFDENENVIEDQEDESNKACSETLKDILFVRIVALKNFLKLWSKKMRGANVQPPPGMPFQVSVFVLAAAFVNCFIIICINTQLKRVFGEIPEEVPENLEEIDCPSSRSFEHGQIASVATMAYALTASPAAQPRSIILGRLISMFVGMTFALIPPEEGTCVGGAFDSPIEWVRFAGAIAVATSLMAKLGIAHPPGGPLALIFLKYQWNESRSFVKIAILLLQDSIFIILASALNNLHSSKSYPTYWGHIPNMMNNYVRSFFNEKDKAMNE